MNIKVVALDMDGTLLDDDGVVSDYTKQVIRQVLEKDIHVILTTGRPLRSCYPYAGELGLPSFIISSNGGEIWTVEKELLSRSLFDTDVLQSLWTLGNEMGLHMWTTATTEIFHNSTRPRDFQDYEWLKIGFGQLDEATKARLTVKLQTDFTGIEITNSSATNIEINPLGVNKAAALMFICDEIGITMDQVIAMGDSLNDLRMIEQAGIGVAMGNAQALVKERANHVTDTNNLDGVAKALEKFVLR